MTQNIIVIGDTHFGIKNNSMTWLKHQVAGFQEIIEYIRQSTHEFDTTTIVHMGDLFDSRSSINPLVYKAVFELLGQIDEILNDWNCDGEMYIIGGNHDYYYPWESERNYTGIQMLPPYEHIYPVTNHWQNAWDLTFIPWFDFANTNMLRNILTEIPMNNYIFTHTDPYHFDLTTVKLIEGRHLITGHIHQPEYNPGKQLLVTGATYPTDFVDTNSKRGFWTLQREHEGNICKIIDPTPFTVEFHEVKSSIHFHTITEDVLGHWQELGIQEDDYVEVRIRQSRIDDYKDVIKELHDRFTTSITHIPEENSIVFENMEVLTVDTVCQQLLPDKLKSLYQNMVEAIEQK